MKKNQVFVLRMSERDLKELRIVAQITERSKSDTLRWALHQVAKVIHEQPERIQLVKELNSI